MLPNQTTAQASKNLARLELDRTATDNLCYIESISPDQTRALVRLANSNSLAYNVFQVRILNQPGVYIPMDASNYVGLLIGNPKSPVGVQLLGKVAPQPYIAHAVAHEVYGQGNKTTIPVDGKINQQTEGLQQQINLMGYPDNRGTVIKPPTKVAREVNPSNPLVTPSPGDYVDESSAFMYVDEEEARLVADPQVGIVASKQSGVCIAGPLNISASLQDIRLQGAWRFNPMHQYQIPSTAVSPQPVLVYDPPALKLTTGLDSLISNILKS